MTNRNPLLGAYEPGASVFHAWPVGRKYLLFLVLVLPGIITGAWPVSLALLVFTALLLVGSGLKWRAVCAVPGFLLVFVAGLLLYHGFFTTWQQGLSLSSNLLTCIVAIKAVTLTTPVPLLIDALVKAFAWLRFLRLDPERFALSVAVFMRSVPYIFTSWQLLRQAAWARGQEQNPVLLLSPFVVSTVGYAQRTGQALAARGLS